MLEVRHSLEEEYQRKLVPLLKGLRRLVCANCSLSILEYFQMASSEHPKLIQIIKF